MNDIKFRLKGLTCESCVKIATKRFLKVPGVTEVNIDLTTGNTHVLSDVNVDLDTLQKSLADTDYLIVK